MPLCTTPDTTSQWRCTVHPDTNRESLRYVTVILSTTHFQQTLYKHCAKWQRNSKEIKYCCVHTRLAPSFGSGDTSRISMIYKWHFCRSHILPLISVRYCKTNSLNRNSGTPLCTYYRKRQSHFLFIYSWWLHRITDEAGREVWRSPCPTPLPKADSARAGSPRRYSVRFSVSPETGDSITSLGNLFYCSATLAVRRVL